MFTFLVPAYPGCPGKRPLNDVVAASAAAVKFYWPHAIAEGNKRNWIREKTLAIPSALLTALSLYPQSLYRLITKTTNT